MKTHSVLLAESDPLIAQTYSDFLCENGCSVTIEPYGENVIYRMRTSKPDILIMNNKLLKRDGFSILEERSNDPGLLSIPVILLTEDNRVSDIERAGKLGVHEYFHSTNVAPESLCRAVEEILG